MRANPQTVLLDQLSDPDTVAQATPGPFIPIKRHTTKKFYFRTDHGHRHPSIRIPGVARAEDEYRSPEEYAFLKRKYEKKYTAEERAIHAAAYEANGSDLYITFRQVPQRFESFFETDNADLAAYIRGLIASGDLPFAYEDSRLPTTDPSYNEPVHRVAARLRVQKSEQADAA